MTAAYFLLLQSALGAFAFGAAPQATRQDAFGNVICTHDGAAQGPADSGRNTIPPCCALGCLIATPLLAPPTTAAAPVHAIRSEPLAFLPAASAHLSFARERSPANPRAPPSA